MKVGTLTGVMYRISNGTFYIVLKKSVRISCTFLCEHFL